jgi:hypothetical protein
MDTEDWLHEPFTRGQAWIDMLMLANHTKGSIRVRGIIVDLDRGQLGWSEENLALRWKWSRGKVRRFFSELGSETVQRIVQQKNNVSSVITILNYDRYQGDDTQDGTADGTPNGHQKDTKRYTNNNGNNGKNEKNRDRAGFQPPTEGDVLEVAKSYGDDPQTSHMMAVAFFAYWQSAGWKRKSGMMKNWQAGYRLWRLNEIKRSMK